MFPLRDDNPTLHTSFATFLIIAINVVVWLFVQGMGTTPYLAESICRYGVIPGEILGKVRSHTSVPLGPHLVCVLDGHPNWMTLATSIFMHGGWLHLIGNMWFLAVFGDNVEDVMGSVRFVLFYLLCGLAAAAAQIVSNPSNLVPMVGASGAIGGVMGAYCMLFPRAPVHMLVWFGFYFTRIIIPAFFMLGYWFVLQLLSGFLYSGSGGIAFWAHVGGFAAGVALVRLFCKPQRLSERRVRRGRIYGVRHRY